MRAGFDVRRRRFFSLVALVTFLLLYLPIAVLVIYAFNHGVSMARWEGFSLHWFQKAWENEIVIAVSIRSFQIATIASIIATILATMVALATTRTKPYPGLTFKFALVNQPLMMPEIVTAVALLVFFARIKMATGYSGLGYLILAHTAFCIPFAYLSIRARLVSMDINLEHAAQDLYANRWQTFCHVTFPQLWPGIFAGLVLAFVISLDDVIITEFVKSSGQDTLPTYMLGQMRRSITPEMNAIAVAFLLLSVMIVSLFFIITQYSNRKFQGGVT